MLSRLSIRDIVLIDRLDIEFGSGLSILTGETGAGKSILLDALSLALGARGDGALVRQGQPQGQVAAVFELAEDHPAIAAVRGHDIETDGALVLKRVQLADGRTRASINGEPVSAQVLRGVARGLVEIHGQHDERALLDTAGHRALVDSFGALSGQTDAVRAAFANLRAIEADLEAETARLESARRDAAFLRHSHAELIKLGAAEGEEEELATRRAAMMAAEKVVADIREASENLSGDGSAAPILAAAVRRLQRRAAQAPALIDPCVIAIDRALEALDAASQAVETALREAAFDPNDLERAEERLFALRASARKFAVAPDALGALALRFAADLAALDAGEARLAALTASQAEAARAYERAAATLTRGRLAACRELEGAVNAELPPLKLERAKFIAEIATDPKHVSADGADRIEFSVQTNPGARAGALMKVASGGELARFLLALKVALADRGSAPTLVFDEIDTGVGGAVADAIGLRLARLGEKVQVLAVTHAPQVAARSTHHFRIIKEDVGDRVATSIRTLDSPARREEIARMLAGAKITDEARAAARRLIESAR